MASRLVLPSARLRSMYEFGRRQRPEPGLCEQLRRDVSDELGDLGNERLDRLRQHTQAPQLVAGDPDAHRLLGAGKTPPDRVLHFAESNAPPGSALFHGTWGPRIARRLARAEQTMRVRIARDELRRIRELSQTIKA